MMGVGLGSLACRRQSIPPLPNVVTTGFPVRVRAQVDAAVHDAVTHPADGAASGRLGMILHTYQQLDLAEICYRRAHLLDPQTFAWAYYLTVVEEVHGEIREAIDDGRAAVKLDPANRPARMRLADALLLGHDFKESRGIAILVPLVAEEPDLAVCITASARLS